MNGTEILTWNKRINPNNSRLIHWLATIISLNELISNDKSVSVFISGDQLYKIQYGMADFLKLLYLLCEHNGNAAYNGGRMWKFSLTLETGPHQRSTEQFNLKLWSASHSVSVVMDWSSAGSEPTAWCCSACLELFFGFTCFAKVVDRSWNLVHYLVEVPGELSWY